MKKIFFKISCALVIFNILASAILPSLVIAQEFVDLGNGAAGNETTFNEYSADIPVVDTEQSEIPQEPEATLPPQPANEPSVPAQPTPAPTAEPEPVVTPSPEQIEEERQDLAQPENTPPPQITQAPVVDEKTQDDALGEYDKAATKVADATDLAEQLAREEGNQGGQLERVITDIEATASEIPEGVSDGLQNIMTGTNSFFNPGFDPENPSYQGALSQKTDKIDTTSDDDLAARAKALAEQPFNPDQMSSIAQQLGLPSDMSQEDLLAYLNQFGFVGNINVQGGSLDNLKVVKPPEINVKDIKAQAEGAEQLSKLLTNPTSQLLNLGSNNVVSAFISVGPDSAANKESQNELETMRQQTSFKTPTILGESGMTEDELARELELKRMTPEQLQEQVRALIAQGPEGQQKAQQLVADKEYVDALVKYDDETYRRNEKFGKNLVVGTMLMGGAAGMAKVIQGIGWAAEVAPQAVRAISPITQVIGRVPFVGGVINKILPVARNVGTNLIKSKLDEELTKEEQKQKEDELKKKTGDLTPAQITVLQNRSTAQVSVEYQTCLVNGGSDCDKLKDQKAYADLVKQNAQDLQDDANETLINIGVNIVSGVAGLKFKTDAAKTVLKNADTSYTYGKKGAKAVIQINRLKNAQVLINGQWVDSISVDDSYLIDEEVDDNGGDNSDEQGMNTFSIVTKAFASEIASSSAVPISQADFVLLKTKQQLLKELDKNGSLTMDQVKEKLVQNIVIPSKGIKTKQGVTLITDSSGLAKASVDQGSYIISVTPSEGVDFTIPAKIKVSNKDLTLAIGIREGSGQVKNISQGQKLNSLVSNVLAAQPAPTSVTITTFYDQNSNGKWDGNEHSVPWAGVEVQLKKVNQDQALDLNNGWNLFTLTSLPSKPLTASGLLKDIATQEGYATTVSTLNDGVWQSYVVRGDKTFSGDDFPIEPGKAYFIKILKKSAYIYQGQDFADPLKLTIKSGWNAIGIPKSSQSYTSAKLLDGLNNNKISSDVVSRWESGIWESLLRVNKEDFGNDYELTTNRGYIIKADTSGEFSP